MRELCRLLWYRLFRKHPWEYLEDLAMAHQHQYPSRLVLRLTPDSYLAAVRRRLFSTNRRRGFFETAVMIAINTDYYSQNDGHIRLLNRQLFWGADAGARWHTEKAKQYSDAQAFEDDYMRYRRVLVQQLHALVAAGGGRFRTVCEIGTGNGLFISHLSAVLQGIERFVGVDINAETTVRNQQNYRSGRAEFVCCDAFDWLAREGADGTILVTCGTLEYFTQKELLDLLGQVKQQDQFAAVAICEPVNIDLSIERQSQPRGGIAFSHNYPDVFATARYEAFRVEALPVAAGQPHHQTVVMIATTHLIAAPAPVLSTPAPQRDLS